MMQAKSEKQELSLLAYGGEIQDFIAGGFSIMQDSI